MDKTQIVLAIVAGLLGGGFFSFIQFLINRHDEKRGKNKEVLNAIEELKTTSEVRFNALDEKIGVVDAKGDERNAIASRVRILRFCDEIRSGMLHSHDSFQQVLSDIDEYEDYCGSHPRFKNNQTMATIAFIKKNYDDRLDKNDFA